MSSQMAYCQEGAVIFQMTKQSPKHFKRLTRGSKTLKINSKRIIYKIFCFFCFKKQQHRIEKGGRSFEKFWYKKLTFLLTMISISTNKIMHGKVVSSRWLIKATCLFLFAMRILSNGNKSKHIETNKKGDRMSVNEKFLPIHEESRSRKPDTSTHKCQLQCRRELLWMTNRITKMLVQREGVRMVAVTGVQLK